MMLNREELPSTQSSSIFFYSIIKPALADSQDDENVHHPLDHARIASPHWHLVCSDSSKSPIMPLVANDRKFFSMHLMENLGQSSKAEAIEIVRA